MPEKTLGSLKLPVNIALFCQCCLLNQTVCTGLRIVRTIYLFDIEFLPSFILSFRMERIIDKEYWFPQSGTNKQAQLWIQAIYMSDFICCCVSVQRQLVSQFSENTKSRR